MQAREVVRKVFGPGVTVTVYGTWEIVRGGTSEGAPDCCSSYRLYMTVVKYARKSCLPEKSRRMVPV